MHKPIKRFGLDGIVGDDADFSRLRAQYETLIVQQMRDEGYIPVLDLGPFWATKYHEAENRYDFVLSVYGINVGRRKAWDIEGISNGKMIPRRTPQSKSKPSSETAE